MMSLMNSLLALVCVIAVVSGRRVVDLTHTFDGNATKYPLTWFGVKNFNYYEFNMLYEGYYNKQNWLALGRVEFYEHMGTHMDAPNHFGNGRQALHEIPPERLMGPGVVINVKDKIKGNPNYGVSVDDIKEYERKYGRIPSNAIVCMNSGWAQKYPNPNLIFGTETPGNQSTFNFPGFSLEACKMLLSERQVSVVVTDTPSTDPAQPGPYLCHEYLQPNNVPLVEYIANLDSIPEHGTTMFLGVFKHRGGTGGPVRIFAVVDDDTDDGINAASSLRGYDVAMVLPLFRLLLSVYSKY